MEGQFGDFGRLLWSADRDSYLSVTDDGSMRVLEAEWMGDAHFDADCLARLVALNSPRAPSLALFVKHRNELNLKRMMRTRSMWDNGQGTPASQAGCQVLRFALRETQCPITHFGARANCTVRSL